MTSSESGLRPAATPADGTAIARSDPQTILRRRVLGRGQFGFALVGPLAGVAAAICVLIASGTVPTSGGALGVATSAPVFLLALVPVPALQLVLALRRRRYWPAQDVYLWFQFAAADDAARAAAADPAAAGASRAAADATAPDEPKTSATERELQHAMQAALLATDEGGDGLAVLAGAGRTLGRPPARYARRILLTRYSGVIAALLAGIWIIVAIVVAMAAAGGVVWL